MRNWGRYVEMKKVGIYCGGCRVGLVVALGLCARIAWTRAEAIPNGSSPGAMCIRMLTYDGEVSPVSESHTE